MVNGVFASRRDTFPFRINRLIVCRHLGEQYRASHRFAMNLSPQHLHSCSPNLARVFRGMTHLTSRSATSPLGLSQIMYRRAIVI